MKILNIALAVFILVGTRAGAVADEANKDPDISEVQRIALEYARIRPDEISGLKKRVRSQAMLPRFQVGLTQAFQNNVNVALSDNVSVTSSGTNIGPESSDIKQYSNSDSNFEVKAIWYLNELIYSRDMLDVAEEARFQIRERRELLSMINKLYFERQRLLEELKKKPEPMLRMQLSEITANLDAYTGGWFSNSLRGYQDTRKSDGGVSGYKDIGNAGDQGIRRSGNQSGVENGRE